MGSVIRVLVADDEPLIRAGIAAVLEATADIEVVAEAEDNRAAVELAVRCRPDVALWYLDRPVPERLRALELLRERAPRVRVVVLTPSGDPADVVAAAQHLAAGFVRKTCTPDELVHAVRAAHGTVTHASKEYR